MKIDQLLAELERQLAERRERKGVDMIDLVKRLRIKAGMIEMGEMIAWGSDSALMREAADALEMAAPDVQVENWRHDSEDLEALHNNLDDAGTPRHDSSGIEYSAWGRVIQYAKAATPQPAEQQTAPDVITTAMLEAIWRDGFDAENYDDQAYCQPLIIARIAVEEAQLVPDVSALVEALEQVIKAAPSGGPLWHGSEQIVEARAALAAHRKGGEV